MHNNGAGDDAAAQVAGTARKQHGRDVEAALDSKRHQRTWL